jgi:hypothetical protein
LLAHRGSQVFRRTPHCAPEAAPEHEVVWGGNQSKYSARLRTGDSEHLTQPGYEVLTDRYAEVFPGPYQSPVEEHAIAAFGPAD